MHRACKTSVLATLLFLGVCDFLLADTITVPNDQTTIQAAIDAAKPGDTILVHPGTYKERIRLKAGIVIKSQGDDTKGSLGLKRAETTIIDGRFEGAAGPGVEMAEESTLDGFTVTGVGTYDAQKWKRHYETQGEAQSHDPIGAPGSAGIAVDGIMHCTVKNNIVHHIGYTGIAITGAPGKRVSPNILRNTSYRNMGGGIGSMKQSMARIEENVCFENFYAGIGLDNSSPFVLGNRCYHNVRAGIGISEGSCAIVRNNKCYENRRAGIGSRTGSTTKPIIEENDCYQNDMAGIGTSEEASPIIRNNRCFQNKLAGIGSQTGATPTIVGNECYENEKSGIGQMSDAVTTLIGNHCHHNHASGIGFEACSAGQSTVLHNKVIDNALVAVGIHAGWNIRFVGNRFSREGGMPPIVMVFQGAEAIFQDNLIQGGGVAGIRCAGKLAAINNEFVGTSLRRGGPPNFAVWGLSGSEITLTQNSIGNWRHALHATKSVVTANENNVQNFHKTAFVVQDPSRPANIYNNTALSKDTGAQVLSISGKKGLVTNNRLTQESN